jgi:hypothetical protein
MCYGNVLTCVRLSVFRRDVDGILVTCVSVASICVGSPHTLATGTHITSLKIYVKDCIVLGRQCNFSLTK